MGGRSGLVAGEGGRGHDGRRSGDGGADVHAARGAQVQGRRLRQRRILLGGKVVVTVRERSTLTITEAPGLSTIDLASGRISVAVDKTRMKPGERVDVGTPNAVAGVRGTVLVVEALRDTSTVTVLRGLVDVARRDPVTGRPTGAITAVGALEAVSVRNNVLPVRPEAITPSRSRELSSEFTPPLKRVLSTAVVPVQEELERAGELLKAALPTPAASVDLAISTGTVRTSPTLTTAPAKTNSANYGPSLLKTSSGKRLPTMTTTP
jgi:hypothetical protein